MRKIVYALTWFFVFSIPWKNALVFFGTGTSTKLIGILAIVAGVFCVLLRQRLRKLHLFHYASALFVGWVSLSLIWTIDVDSTAMRIVTFVQILGMLWLIWEFARTRERQKGLLKAYVLGTYVAAFYTLGRYMVGVETGIGRYGTTGFNVNDVGGLLVLGIPMAWYLATQEKRSLLRLLYQGYVVISLPATLLTGSRSAFLAAGVALLIVPFSYSNFGFRGKLVTAVIVLLGAYAVVSYVPPDTWKRIATTQSEISTGGLGNRGPIWMAGLDVFPQHPVLGVGAGAYYKAMVPYFQRGVAPHNVYLAFLVELGIVGLVLFLCPVAVVAWPVVRRMKGAERTFWLVLLFTLAVVLFPRNWEYRKPMWLILGLLSAWNAAPLLKEAAGRAVRVPHTPAS